MGIILLLHNKFHLLILFLDHTLKFEVSRCFWYSFKVITIWKFYEYINQNNI